MITYFKLFEKKNLAVLYHLLDVNKMNFVLDTNTIKSYKFSNISLTRNKMMSGYLGDNSGTIIKLEIDSEKLNNKYKIAPFRYVSYTNIVFTEWEEIVKTTEIKNAFSYIKKVILIKKNIESLKHSVFDDDIVTDWFTTIGTRNGNMSTIIKNIKEKLEQKYNQTLYVQDGSEIKEDNEYIDSIINYDLVQIETKNFIAYRGKIPLSRQYSYEDVLVDIDGNILMSPLVIGGKIEIPNNIQYISDNEVIKNIESIFISKYKDNEKYSSTDGIFKPYIINTRKMKNYWKVDDIRPL